MAARVHEVERTAGLNLAPRYGVARLGTPAVVHIGEQVSHPVQSESGTAGPVEVAAGEAYGSAGRVAVRVIPPA